MGVFHVFKIVHMVLNGATHHICEYQAVIVKPEIFKLPNGCKFVNAKVSIY